MVDVNVTGVSGTSAAGTAAHDAILADDVAINDILDENFEVLREDRLPATSTGLTGVEATAAVGTVSNTTDFSFDLGSINLDDLEATGFAGTLTPSGGISFTVTGVSEPTLEVGQLSTITSGVNVVINVAPPQALTLRGLVRNIDAIVDVVGVMARCETQPYWNRVRDGQMVHWARLD